MSYKFNRDCWVESCEDALLGRGMGDEATESNGFNACGSPCVCVPSMVPEEHHAAPLPVERKIALARVLFAGFSDRLRQDATIRRLLDRLRQDLERSRGSMIDLGIMGACARCDESAPEGSCCSRGLERKYDAFLLLINLMLGVSLPEGRSRTDSCHFLGMEGCLLRVRHMLCVDYLCPELEKSLGKESLIEIQTVSGAEIESAFLLREAVKKVVLSAREK